MKRLFLFIVFSISILSTYAQSIEDIKAKIAKSDKEIADPKKNIKAKPWITRGQLFMDSYAGKNLSLNFPAKANALQGIAMGVEDYLGKPKNIKTEGNNQTWEYDRITVYFTDGFVTKWTDHDPLGVDVLAQSLDCYKKAIELEPAVKEKSGTVKDLTALRTIHVNIAYSHYSAERFENSMISFENALAVNEYIVNPKDTTFKKGEFYLYAGSMAQICGKFDKAINYFNTALTLNYKPADCYLNLGKTYYEGLKDKDKALAMMKEGFEKYKTNDLLIELINFYMTEGILNEAIIYLDKAIAADDKNPQFYFAKGNVYDRMQTDTITKPTEAQKLEAYNNAAALYSKSIELKKDYFDAYYNLGALHYNRGVMIFTEAQKIPTNQPKKYDEEIAKVTELNNKALPMFETALTLNPTDLGTLQSLKILYQKMKMKDKMEEVKQKIEELQK